MNLHYFGASARDSHISNKRMTFQSIICVWSTNRKKTKRLPTFIIISPVLYWRRLIVWYKSSTHFIFFPQLFRFYSVFADGGLDRQTDRQTDRQRQFLFVVCQRGDPTVGLGAVTFKGPNLHQSLQPYTRTLAGLSRSSKNLPIDICAKA